MAKSTEETAWEKDRAKVLGNELRSIMHEEPSKVHLDRAAEAVGLTEETMGLMPLFTTNARLIAWVRSVKAAAGASDAFADFADRFDPKPSRPAVAVNVSPTAAAPVASSNSEEQASAENYYDRMQKGAA